jgi:hypothetical protein
MRSATWPCPRWRYKEAMPWVSSGFRAIASPRPQALLAVLLVVVPFRLCASDFECKLGREVVASLGDGVTMRTCRWEKTPGVFVRAGPLQLVKNEILILQLKTDESGRLQGQYTAWNDDGVMVENGVYHDGLKQGEWLVTDAEGRRKTLYFNAGEPRDP